MPVSRYATDVTFFKSTGKTSLLSQRFLKLVTGAQVSTPGESWNPSSFQAW